MWWWEEVQLLSLSPVIVNTSLSSMWDRDGRVQNVLTSRHQLDRAGMHHLSWETPSQQRHQHVHLTYQCVLSSLHKWRSQTDNCTSSDMRRGLLPHVGTLRGFTWVVFYGSKLESCVTSMFEHWSVGWVIGRMFLSHYFAMEPNRIRNQFYDSTVASYHLTRRDMRLKSTEIQ